MLYVRIKAIEIEGLHDKAKEEKGNTYFSDFIVNKNSKNIALGFYRYVPTIQESAMILHKVHLSFHRHFKDNFYIIIF